MRKYNGGEWTEARFKSFVVSALRTATQRWPPKYAVLDTAFTQRKTNVKTGKLAKHFECNACKDEFVAKEVQVDHKNPAVDPKKGWQGWDTFIDRLFCEETNLQVLCSSCHRVKTAKEKEERKDAKVHQMPTVKTAGGDVKGRSKANRTK
tara:strand:- start:2258 stop:2707 length:450 start_codon:yes stop_codon:yes gene_type:complete